LLNILLSCALNRRNLTVFLHQIDNRCIMDDYIFDDKLVWGDSFFLNIRLVWAYPGIIFASKSMKKEFYGDIKTKTEEDGFALSRRANC